MKISEIIKKISLFHGEDEGQQFRFDKVIYGDVDRECTGIVTTCCGTVEVIKKAAECGANLLIVHEPIFFESRDDEEKINEYPLVAEKKRLLDELGITVWRDHDHMHGRGGPNVPVEERTDTDYIYYGIMKVLGWENYLSGAVKKPLLYDIPVTTVKDLCVFLKDRLGLNGVRVVGDLDAKVRRVFICEHVNGNFDDKLMRRLDALNADVFIPLEIVDWTLTEYVRDSCAMGRGRAILEMGHFNFEEPGMRWMAEDWLPKLLGGEVPVRFIQSGDCFEYVV